MGSGAPFVEDVWHALGRGDSRLYRYSAHAPVCDSPTGESRAGAQHIETRLEALEGICDTVKPDGILVYGATGTTLLAGLVAAERRVPLISADAGERTFRRCGLDGEASRVLLDHLATLCLPSSERAAAFLRREGIGPQRISVVGDPMYELFLQTCTRLGLTGAARGGSRHLHSRGYHLAVLHGVGCEPDVLMGVLEALEDASKPVLLLADPYVGRFLRQQRRSPENNLRLMGPVSHVEYVEALLGADCCVTDCPRFAREAFWAKRRCVITTEPVCSQLVDSGWAVVTGGDRRRITQALECATEPAAMPDDVFGDGHSGRRYVEEIAKLLDGGVAHVGWHPLGSWDQLPRPHSSRLTLRAYVDLVQALKKRGYDFRGFPEAAAALEEDPTFVLMRHDIDFSLEAACRMAEVEAAHGIRSTYFFMIRTEHYNVFSPDGTQWVRKILALGHHLGLHVDGAAYSLSSAGTELAARCEQEATMLEAWFGIPVEVISFHRPNEYVLAGSPALTAPRLHTYMELFRGRMTYMSDSRGRWRDGSPDESDVFREGRPLHLLVHPIWWGSIPEAPFARLEAFLDERWQQLRMSVAENNTVFRVGMYERIKD
ncbi:MAG TPA: UDP-N-acetylglucosamine 2-epimerase [Longimicrobiales bacterium]|nr:UDP-N-acetylglucosamine 2-epimerase [Longimicrobiales bacterium]